MRTTRFVTLLLVLALVPAMAFAQTSLTADRIYLGATGCAMRTGAGTPTGGAACDFYLDTATGHVWVNHAGTWIDVSTRTPTFQTVTATTSVTTPTVAATTKLTTPLIDTATGNLQLQPVGDLVLGPAGRDVLPGVNYTTNLGALEDKYLTLHAAELWVETLVAQQTMATIGGRVLVAPTNILAADLPAAATTITVKYNNFQNGDRVYLEANGRVEFMSTTSTASGSAGAYTYTVTRNLDGSGADAWSAGDALLNTGQVGNGFIDLYSVAGVLSGAGPTIVGNVRTGNTFNQIEPRWAIGNLNGLYGYSGSTYGAAFGSPTGAWVKIDDTNGVRLGNNTTTNVQITPAGAATFSGTINAAAGNIGGWAIGADYLRDAGDSTGMASSVSAGNDVRFWAGASFANRSLAPFRVYEDGSTVMSSAIITAPNAGSGGAALNADADTRDIGLWANCDGACQIASIGDGKVGGTSLRSVTGQQGLPVENRRIPFDANKTYRFHLWARAGGGANGTLYAGLSAFDASGVECDANGCPRVGQRYAYCANGVTAASLTTWTEYTCTYGAGSGYPIPAGMRTVAVQAILNLGATAGWMELQDVRFEEMAPSTLIKDGAITTNKITANAITAGKIAANTITVAELNATGFGDNVIKNGTFEPSLGDAIGSASALAGWTKDLSNSSSSGVPTNASGGLAGPGTMLLDPGNGTYLTAVYLAFPLERLVAPAGGTKYRVSGSVYATNATGAAGGMHVLIYESTEFTGGVRRVLNSGATYPDLTRTSQTILAACQALPQGWSSFEYTYTPPAGVVWASLVLADVSGTTCGSTYTPLYFDDVEMQKQIGAGHIKANSITATQIATGTLTAAQIAAGTITGDKIAASTITGTNIAADSITSAHIVAGTITASDIAAGTITADRLNVTALSAISANLGSVTAGSLNAVAITGGTIDGTTIRGVTITASSSITGGTVSGTSITSATIDGSTITAGSGSVVLNASGITVGNGDSNANARIKLGPSELWGGSFGLSTAGGMNAGALLVNGGSHLVGGVTADVEVTVGGTVTAGQLTLNKGQGVYFQSSGGAGPTLTWQASTSPPSGSGSNMGYNSGCACLVFISSSVRFKENLRPWTASDPLAILSLPLYRYDFRNEPTGDHVVIPSKDHVGFTVEDLIKIAPDAVTHDAQGRPESFYSDTLDTYLLAALKAVNARISRLDGLTARTSGVEALEARIRELEKKIAALEAAAKKKD